MKLLIMSPLPPPVGGIASWTLHILDYYSTIKTDWKIYHQNTAIRYREITNLRTLLRIYFGIIESLEILFKLKSNIKSIKPDVIHLTSSSSFALYKDYLITIIARKKGIPVIIHFRFGRIPDLIQQKNWEWKMLCRVIEKSSRVVVIDQRSYLALTDWGFLNIVNIPNPCSSKLIENSRSSFKKEFSSENGRIIFIGHVIKNKGIYELVKACTWISEVKELMVIGPCEKSVREELISMAAVRGNSEWLNLCGQKNIDVITNCLKNGYIFVLPSFTEGFPNVLIEAMAMGCPVIASNVGAIPEMLDIKSDNPCGICINPGSIHDLELAIKKIIDDPDLAQKYGSNGRNKVLSEYNMDIVSKSYEALWLDAVNKKSNQYV